MKDLNKIEKMAVVVDMIDGFVKYGAMHDKEIANIIPNQIELLRKMQDEQSIIAIVKDTHEEKCKEFDSYPAHCVKGTGEENLVEELREFENENSLVYEKNSTSVAHVPEFFEDIKKMKNLKEIIVMGCCTDICVMQAAIPLKTFINQHDLNIEVIVPKNTVETYNAPVHNREEYNEMSYKLMSQAGIKVVESY